VAVDLLLDAAADLVDRVPGQGHHMERVEDGCGVGELVVDGVLVATNGSRVATSTWALNAFPRASSHVL